MLKTEAVNLETPLETPLEKPEIEPEIEPEQEPEPEPEPKPKPEPEIEQLEPPTPKKKGRPVGARSKIQGKPRAPRKKVTIESEPVSTPQSPLQETRTLRPEEKTNTIRIENENHPRFLPNSRPIPEFSFDEQSTLMLKLLSEHAAQKKKRNVDLFRNWYT